MVRSTFCLVVHTQYAAITAHTVHKACTGALSVCICEVCIGGSHLQCIADPGITTLPNMTTIAIPHANNRNQTWDTVVESQCYKN